MLTSVMLLSLKSEYIICRSYIDRDTFRDCIHIHVQGVASNQALPLRAQLFKRGKMKEGESLEDLDHVLDMDDVFWTWFSISG